MDTENKCSINYHVLKMSSYEPYLLNQLNDGASAFGFSLWLRTVHFEQM